MNINCLKCLAVRRQRSGIYNFPARLKTLSTAAEDAWTDKNINCYFRKIRKVILSVSRISKDQSHLVKPVVRYIFRIPNHLTSQILVPLNQIASDV